MIKENDISHFLYSRYAVALFAIIAIITTHFAIKCGEVTPIMDNKGLGLLPFNQWLAPGIESMIANIILNFAIAGLMIYLNKTFNILRNPTNLFATLFIILQIPLTDITGQLYGGTILCAIMLICTFILFTTFYNPNPHAIFLIFTILSLGAFFQYAFLFFIPITLLGCMQMRIFNLRIFLAALFGIITPPWILYGLGILNIENFTLPQFNSIYEYLSPYETLHMFMTIGLSVFICIGSWFANIVKIISYNARTRAFNGFFSLLSLASILLILIDFTNYIIYIPLLNCCTALQLGHLFTIYESRRSYLGIIGIFIFYIGLYLWGIWI